jgi:hypothetical protein
MGDRDLCKPAHTAYIRERLSVRFKKEYVKGLQTVLSFEHAPILCPRVICDMTLYSASARSLSLSLSLSLCTFYVIGLNFLKQSAHVPLNIC